MCDKPTLKRLKKLNLRTSALQGWQIMSWEADWIFLLYFLWSWLLRLRANRVKELMRGSPYCSNFDVFAIQLFCSRRKCDDLYNFSEKVLRLWAYFLGPDNYYVENKHELIFGFEKVVVFAANMVSNKILLKFCSSMYEFGTFGLIFSSSILRRF